MAKSRYRKASTEQRTVIYPRGQFRPEDWLCFVQLPGFERRWAKLGLLDDELRELEVAIMAMPTGGDLIPGTGGLRKLRCAPRRWRQGKSGALRVCYTYFEDLAIVVLATVYAKNESANLSEDEKAVLRQVIPAIRDEFGRVRPRGAS